MILKQLDPPLSRATDQFGLVSWAIIDPLALLGYGSLLLDSVTCSLLLKNSNDIVYQSFFSIAIVQESLTKR